MTLEYTNAPDTTRWAMTDARPEWLTLLSRFVVAAAGVVGKPCDFQRLPSDLLRGH